MLVNYDVEERRKSKMKSDDRVLVLKTMEDRTAKTTAGNVDKRLFNGENNLHAIYNPNTGMWTMKYSMGALPGGLEGQFVLFSELVAKARDYFKKRNVEIAEIKE